MLRLKECISITWDKDLNVFGISMKRSGQLTNSLSCSDKGKSFSERLKYVFEKIYKSQGQFIIIGGHIPSAVCFEIVMPPLPKKEVEQYLRYELFRQLPYPINELKWCYRFLPQNENLLKKNIKIFAVLEKEWNELFNDIISSGIRVDRYIYPFFAIEPLLNNQNISFSDIDEDFFLVSSTGTECGYMKINSVKSKSKLISPESLFKEGKFSDCKIENKEKFFSSFVLSEYFFSKEFIKDDLFCIEIDNELKPKRFKGLKITSFILLVILLLLSGSYFVRTKINVMNVLNTLNKEIVLLSENIKIINSKYSKVKRYDIATVELNEATPSAINPVEYMELLTRKIPKNVWLTSFSSNKDKVDIKLQTNSATRDFTAALNRNNLFTTENIRKTRTGAGIQHVYLSLKSYQPDEE